MFSCQCFFFLKKRQIMFQYLKNIYLMLNMFINRIIFWKQVSLQVFVSFINKQVLKTCFSSSNVLLKKNIKPVMNQVILNIFTTCFHCFPIRICCPILLDIRNLGIKFFPSNDFLPIQDNMFLYKSITLKSLCPLNRQKKIINNLKENLYFCLSGTFFHLFFIFLLLK